MRAIMLTRISLVWWDVRVLARVTPNIHKTKTNKQWTFPAVHDFGALLEPYVHLEMSSSFCSADSILYEPCEPVNVWHIVSRIFFFAYAFGECAVRRTVRACLTTTPISFLMPFPIAMLATSASSQNLVAWRLNGLMVRQKPTSHLFAFHFHKHDRKSLCHGAKYVV